MRKRALRTICLVVLVAATSACSTLPEPKHKRYGFPKNAFVGAPVPARPYEGLGLVRTKVDYPSLDPNREEDDLCKNYYNKAVIDLLRRAREQGANAIIDIKTVVFFEDGKHAVYATPECSDDGNEGQVLAQAIAIRWKGDTSGKLNPEDFARGAKRPLKKVPVPKPGPGAIPTSPPDSVRAAPPPSMMDLSPDDNKPQLNDPELDGEPTPEPRGRAAPSAKPQSRRMLPTDPTITR